MKMIKPDYSNSIVNVTNSILGKENKIKELKNLKKKIILMIIDGMGYNFLVKNSALKPVRKITSVFPSTTATAITSITSGKEPCEHALTGWYMFLKELGSIIAPLPFYIRYKHMQIPKGFEKKLFPQKKFKIIVTDDKIKKKEYATYGYKTTAGFFRQTLKAIKNHNLIYTYYPHLDTIEHKFGPNSIEAKNHMKLLEKNIHELIKKLPKDTSLIITADHGQMQTTKKETFVISDELKKMMVLPLTGEPRAAYAFIKNGFEKKFYNCVKKNYSDKLIIKHTKDVIDEGFFGIKKINPKLLDRIGDFILFTKNNFVIKDPLFDEQLKFKKGNHGGISEDEMFVPLLRYDK